MYVNRVKAALDRLCAFAALCILWPLLLLLSAAGAVMMRGSPFFVQTRIGKDEKSFRLVKFRSMTDRRDASGALLPDEQRLTRYGRFLRKTSLDELPELVNILRGEMSLVGPRPLLPEYLPYYTEQERLRHTVRPGLTGLAQINGRNNINSWEERFAFDLAYVRSCSFRRDVKILAATAALVVSRKGVLTGSEIPAGRLDDARRRTDADHRQEIHGTGYRR